MSEQNDDLIADALERVKQWSDDDWMKAITNLPPRTNVAAAVGYIEHIPAPADAGHDELMRDMAEIVDVLVHAYRRAQAEDGEGLEARQAALGFVAFVYDRIHLDRSQATVLVALMVERLAERAR